MKMSAKDQGHRDFLNSLRERLNVDDKTIINLEKRITGADRNIKKQISLNASNGDQSKINSNDNENMSKRSRDSHQTLNSEQRQATSKSRQSRTSGHSNGGHPQPRQNSAAQQQMQSKNTKKNHINGGFDKASSGGTVAAAPGSCKAAAPIGINKSTAAGQQQHQAKQGGGLSSNNVNVNQNPASSLLRERRPATNLALKQFDPIAKRFKTATTIEQQQTKTPTQQKTATTAFVQEVASPPQGAAGQRYSGVSSGSKSQSEACLATKTALGGLVKGSSPSPSPPPQQQNHNQLGIEGRVLAKQFFSSAGGQQNNHNQQGQQPQKPRRASESTLDQYIQQQQQHNNNNQNQQSQSQLNNANRQMIKSPPPLPTTTMITNNGFSGINNNAGANRQTMTQNMQQQPSPQQIVMTSSSDVGAAGASSNMNMNNNMSSPQGANLVQTKLAVIDGELINSVQSNRSIEHQHHEQPATGGKSCIIPGAGGVNSNQNAHNHNNDSATYSNSQQSFNNNSCGANLPEISLTSQGSAQIIDEKRHKKRQRKQEKTRKVPQSKVIYNHTNESLMQQQQQSDNNSLYSLTSLTAPQINQQQHQVPSFGAAERSSMQHQQQLQHSSSMGPMLERQHSTTSNTLNKRARIADNVSMIGDQVEISSLQQQESNNRSELEIEMVDQLQKELDQTKKQLREKTIEVEKSTQLFTMFDQQVREMQGLLEQNESLKRIYIDTMIKYLTELEDKSRKERRIFLNEQSIKLGRVSTLRQGSKVVDMWEEGEAIIKLQTRLREIAHEKEEIDKLKKRAKQHRRGQTTAQKMLPPVPVDAFGRSTNGLPLVNENSEFDFEESEFNNIDKNEQREIYQFKQKLFENEERRIKEQLQMLEKEKSAYLIEFKRIRDEEQSKYCGIHRSKTYTVLNDKYLILSILGKGGFSEVYKAFDLENCREVACKIHHFDDSWSDQVKDDYIKHALRENEIHKELNNRRVVKHYDTVEIDHNSFSTILELCSGPDLYNYLKENKQIVEKEAKLIISQILSGLKYLTDQKQKIIHYDLKPQNIIFHNGEVKITDFGLCKIIEENQDKIELTSQGVGTYWYQAPECFDQSKNPQITQKVDIWSVGVIFYELLFGVKPFGHDKSQMAIVRDQTILNARAVQFPQKPTISDGCKDFIRRCLAYHHQDRYDVYESYYSPYLRGISQSASASSAQSKINNAAK